MSFVAKSYKRLFLGGRVAAALLPRAVTLGLISPAELLWITSAEE